MWDTICNWFGDLGHSIVRLDFSRDQWIMISVVVLGAGMIFLRGFGSRTNY